MIRLCYKHWTCQTTHLTIQKYRLKCASEDLVRWFNEQKPPDVKFDDLSSIPRIHMMKEENKLPLKNTPQARQMTQQLKGQPGLFFVSPHPAAWYNVALLE